MPEGENMGVVSMAKQRGVMLGHEGADAVDHGRIAVGKLAETKWSHTDNKVGLGIEGRLGEQVCNLPRVWR